MTKVGEERIISSARRLIGRDALIVPDHIRQIYVSPRQRALRTLELLELPNDIPTKQTELISEWDYGDYEGLTSQEIVRRNGKHWNVFKDGCPNGDHEESITKRVDSLIKDIRQLHIQAHEVSQESRADVLIVAHGHILRAFAARWILDSASNGTRLAYGAGGAVSL